MDLTLDFRFTIDPDANFSDRSYRAAGALTEPHHGTMVRFERV